MCMIIKADQQSQIAETDITVYKLVNLRNGKLFPLYYSVGFEYVLGILNVSNISKLDHETIDIYGIKFYDSDEGLTYKLDIFTRITADVLKDLGLTAIEQGFHCGLTKERLNYDCGSSNVLVECIIPKGSTYFTNDSGLAVSNQLIVNKIIEGN